ncbi:response regulator [Gimesia maris]|uniref:response regulator n=1 Tax=Gimesia maris TaxID=122 RepID=UPI00241F6D94|nr:response regulator [Gimesia maris]|tara:strand:+ start:176393 stop:177007 length:615 start_codon:yes stop_codon:yes gene_type:complete
MKILIVDEIGFIRQSLNQKLGLHHFETVSAESGEEALLILKTDFSIDAVLTSLFLPTMNALDLYKAAAKIERFNDEGVIPPLNFYLMVTKEHGTSSPKMKQLTREALALGFKDLLVKPIDTELLVTKLKNSATVESEEVSTGQAVTVSSQTDNPEEDKHSSRPVNTNNRIDQLKEMQNSLHALKKEMCDSIDTLLEEVSRNSLQ